MTQVLDQSQRKNFKSREEGIERKAYQLHEKFGARVYLLVQCESQWNGFCSDNSFPPNDVITKLLTSTRRPEDFITLSQAKDASNKFETVKRATEGTIIPETAGILSTGGSPPLNQTASANSRELSNFTQGHQLPTIGFDFNMSNQQAPTDFDFFQDTTSSAQPSMGFERQPAPAPLVGKHSLASTARSSSSSRDKVTKTKHRLRSRNGRQTRTSA